MEENGAEALECFNHFADGNVRAGYTRRVFESANQIISAANAKAGSHHYTSNKAEIDMIVKAGWKYEGEAWMAVR